MCQVLRNQTDTNTDCGSHDTVVGIRSIWLQLDGDVSGKLAVRLPRDAPLNKRGDGEEHAGEGKLVVPCKPQKRSSVAAIDPGVPLIGPNYFTILLYYSYISPSLNDYKNKQEVAAGHSTNSTIKTRPKCILLFPRIGQSTFRVICHHKSDSIGLACQVESYRHDEAFVRKLLCQRSFVGGRLLDR